MKQNVSCLEEESRQVFRGSDWLCCIHTAFDKEKPDLANYSHLIHCIGWDFYHPYGIIFSVCTEGEKSQEEGGI